MYNDPQGSYPPQPNSPWAGNGTTNNGTQNFSPPQPQNPDHQWGENGAATIQQSSYPPVQNPIPQTQWVNGTPLILQQRADSPPNQASAQPGFPYAGPSRRSGLVPSRSAPKNNFSMIAIGGATALALIIGLALFIALSNQGQKTSSPVVQTDIATPTATPDMTTPTPGATATPMPTPTVAPTPTADTTTAMATPAPPPAAAPQPAPAPTPKPAMPTPAPKPVTTPTVDVESFTYDNNPGNGGTLVTNPPADFCTPGHEAQNFNVKCVADFFPGNGYVVTCKDGVHVSHNGGNGACGQYKGEGKKWYKHPIKK
jgi:hypothetical protein